MIPIRRRQWMPSRSAMVGILLVLTLGAAGVMAYQAWDATRSHQRIATAAVEEHALSAAWQLTSAIQRSLTSMFLDPGLEAAFKAGGGNPGVPLKDFPNFEKILQDFGWWVGPESVDFLFRLDLNSGKLEIRGSKEPEPEVTQFLKTFLKDQASRGSLGQKRIPAGLKLHGTDGNERVLVYGIGSELGIEAGVAFGIQTDLTPLKKIAEEVAKQPSLLPPALIGGEPTEKVLSFVVRTPSGRAVFESSPQYPAGIQAEDTVDVNFGGLIGAVSINPKAVELLVIGGLPKSRLPTILGLLALTSAMVLVAIFQLRREQELALLRTDFVSSVSHQLRTPLAQIRMFGETLLLGRVRSEEERRRSLEIIVKEAQSLTHQVDNVLHFSRAQRGEIDLSLENAVLAPIITEVLESFCPLAEAKGCRVEESLDESLRAWVDPGALRQILLNLLENAVKYGPPGQIIDVRLRKGAAGTVQLLVEDEGEGIPEDRRAEVFVAYSRLERDRDSGVAGSGIGLAVVRELAQRQGASVWVGESVSGGARFVVAFPKGSTAPGEG